MLANAPRDKTLPAITCVGFPQVTKNNTSVKLFTFFSDAARGCLRPAEQQKEEEEEDDVSCGFFHPLTFLNFQSEISFYNILPSGWYRLIPADQQTLMGWALMLISQLQNRKLVKLIFTKGPLTVSISQSSRDLVLFQPFWKEMTNKMFNSSDVFLFYLDLNLRQLRFRAFRLGVRIIDEKRCTG